MAGKPRQRDENWQRFEVRSRHQGGHGPTVYLVWDRVTARRATASVVYKDKARAKALAKDLNRITEEEANR